MADDIIRIGDNGVRPVGTRTMYRLGTGITTVWIYEGEEEALKVEAAGVLAANGQADVYPYDGPAYRMDVIWPDDGTASDYWERVTEFVQEDLRENPKVISLASTSDTLALWIFLIKTALASGSPLKGVVDPGMQLLYDEMARGVTSHEVRRIILTRRRTLPIGYATPRTPTATESIYTTAALIRLFPPIPAGIQAILPAVPAVAPSGRTWGWKIRQDDSRLIPSTLKDEEVMRWTFAAWSTSLLYDLVT
jgi:hypothetical protein